MLHMILTLILTLTQLETQVIVLRNLGINAILLPSSSKLRRLCFYRCVSVHGGVPNQVHTPRAGKPSGQGSSPWAGTPPGRYTPHQAGTQPLAGTPPPRYTPPGPGTPHDRYPPGTRYITPLGPGTSPPRAGTPTDQVHPPPPRYGHCCGRYASYWNAFLCILFILLH